MPDLRALPGAVRRRLAAPILRALGGARDRSVFDLEDRVRALEAEWRRYRDDLVAASFHRDLPLYHQARFGGDPAEIRRQCEGLIEPFRGRQRVLDIGCGRGIFLALMRDQGIGGYGIDLDDRMLEECRRAGLDARPGDALAHLGGLPAGSLDGIFARHLAEHLLPGELVRLVHECRRVLRPGAPIVMVAPDPATLTVGAHSFWLDPQHVRPLPSALLAFYAEIAGLTDIEVRTSSPSETRLSAEAQASSEDLRLIDRTLFGDRDYAVLARAPSA